MALTTEQLTVLRGSRPSKIGNRLEFAVTISGETKSAIARACGMTPAQLGDLCSRWKNPNVKTMRRVAAYFGCAIDDLWPDPNATRAA